MPATFIIGCLGKIEDVNDEACRLLGYSRSQLLRLHGSELVLPDERPTVAVALDQMRQGIIEEHQGRLLRSDGSVVAVQVNARRLPEERLALVVRELPPVT